MVIGLIVILLFTVFQGAQQGGQEQPNFSEFLKAVDQGRVDSVVIRGNHVTYSLKDSAQTLRTYIVEYPDLIKTLKDRGVRIAVRSEEHTSELQSQSNLVCRLLLEKKKKRPSCRSSCCFAQPTSRVTGCEGATSGARGREPACTATGGAAHSL